MSFLLDVADPSIHFHARQYHNSSSKPLSAIDSSSKILSGAGAGATGAAGAKNAVTSVSVSASSISEAKDVSSSSNNNNNSNSNSNSNSNNMSNFNKQNKLFPSLPGNNPSSGSIPANNMFSAMSRLIRTSSSSPSSVASSPMLLPTMSSSTLVTPSSSIPNTPDAVHVSDPFLTVTSSSSSSSSTCFTTKANNVNTGSTLSPSLSSSPNLTTTLRRPLSPWMMPSVCDDDQMNKLVSFQL
ncbi:hypothetical protein BCR41DRAFT_346588 [Lobosporangium transversale]|uniref:Uncharacterized protein n=1 Tax=Lobosporangium transversale TaxID=64571 RepID=A0A1Y2GZQ9_9FUNG|nr:hypothetical protein BCR41DRAFT_346588 [Lobosporangium transversale]ORZ27274.1 hypothetical protein BCR41DRAFT_346588 [Lobosporangium transversale]|eukprot:XP_021885001.1 hypothetical protein BCR41DRAFT_346588 [Lobosporangium transversale]